MASVSASHLILFIASLVVAVGVAGTFTTNVGQVSSAIDDQSLDVSKEIRTDIQVISDAGSPVYDRDGNGNVTVLVKNTGSQNLAAEPSLIEVLLNGTYRPDIAVTVVDGSTWQTGNVVEITFDASLSSGDHRLKVIVNGDEEVFSFRT